MLAVKADDQAAVLVDVQRLSLARGAVPGRYRHGLAQQRLAGTVFRQVLRLGHAVVQRPKGVQEGGCQRRTGTRRRGIIEQRPGHILQFCGQPSAGAVMLKQTQHRIVQHAAFHVQRGFGQDAADLCRSSARGR